MSVFTKVAEIGGGSELLQNRHNAVHCPGTEQQSATLAHDGRGETDWESVERFVNIYKTVTTPYTALAQNSNQPP